MLENHWVEVIAGISRSYQFAMLPYNCQPEIERNFKALLVSSSPPGPWRLFALCRSISKSSNSHYFPPYYPPGRPDDEPDYGGGSGFTGQPNDNYTFMISGNDTSVNDSTSE